MWETRLGVQMQQMRETSGPMLLDPEGTAGMRQMRPGPHVDPDLGVSYWLQNDRQEGPTILWKLRL